MQLICATPASTQKTGRSVPHASRSDSIGMRFEVAKRISQELGASNGSGPPPPKRRVRVGAQLRPYEFAVPDRRACSSAILRDDAAILVQAQFQLSTEIAQPVTVAKTRPDHTNVLLIRGTNVGKFVCLKFFLQVMLHWTKQAVQH